MVEDIVEDIEEEAQGELVEVVDEIELLQDEEDGATCLSNGEIFGRHLFDLLHDQISLLHLASDLGGFPFERLQGVDNLVVV